jgi:membrane protein YdbS with pleckstrin-like domain
MSSDPRPGDEHEPGDEWRRPPSERRTEPIPTISGTIVDYEEDEYGPVLGPGQGPRYQVELIATREPSDLVRRYLFPTEKFRGEWRRHWIHLVKKLSIGILATFILGYLAGWFAKEGYQNGLTILVIIWFGVIGWVLWGVVEWYYDRFILTNKRIMVVEGVVARKVAMMPLNRVTDMKYTQSPLGRLLNYGMFEVESAGQEQALRKVDNLPNPTDLYLQVVEEMYEPDSSEARRRPAKVDDGL